MQTKLTKEKFLEIVKTQPKIVFCFDYDGTLVELATKDIVKEGRITQEDADVINKLAQHKDIKVAIVTGRALKNLKTLIDGRLSLEIMLYGTHGAELGIESNDTEYAEDLRAIREALELDPHIELEEKQISTTVHYLNHPSPEKLLENLHAIAAKHTDKFRIQRGRDFFEFLPKSINKGLAIVDLNNKFRDYYLIYFGDDLTDNYAFEVINSLGGLSCQITDRIKDKVAGYQIDMVRDLYDLIHSYLIL